ncbi:MAG: ribosome biogenesis GTPase Der [Flavobacteriales bacterium]
MANIVAIIGRPNVGKSTLFNRLTGTREAIVDEVAGVTRDRHYGKCEWAGKEFSVIDTGGYVTGSDDVFEDEIRRQVAIAIEEADVLLFVVDVVSGITDLDEDVADLLRRSRKKVILVANKVDNGSRIPEAGVFYSLGLGEVFCISSISGSGTGELLDELSKHLQDKPEEEQERLPKIAIVGRPNVGKSSFVNALLGENRNIVTSIAGTTRDTINTKYKSFGHEMLLVDTAGLRKKGKVHKDLEFYSVMRTVKAIEHADVCLLLLDANDGIEAQDLNILSLIVRNHKGLVIGVNKWDTIEKDHKTTKEYNDLIKERTAPFTDIPIFFISVKEKQRLLKVVDGLMEVYQSMKQKIPTREFNDYILPIIENFPPPTVKGKFLRIKFATQLKSSYPAFAFYCNHPQYFKDSYKRFLENKIREHYNFTGVPIEIFFRKK